MFTVFQFIFFIHCFALCSLYVPLSLWPIHFMCPFPGFVFVVVAILWWVLFSPFCPIMLSSSIIFVCVCVSFVLHLCSHFYPCLFHQLLFFIALPFVFCMFLYPCALSLSFVFFLFFFPVAILWWVLFWPFCPVIFFTCLCLYGFPLFRALTCTFLFFVCSSSVFLFIALPFVLCMFLRPCVLSISCVLFQALFFVVTILWWVLFLPFCPIMFPCLLYVRVFFFTPVGLFLLLLFSSVFFLHFFALCVCMFFFAPVSYHFFLSFSWLYPFCFFAFVAMFPMFFGPALFHLFFALLFLRFFLSTTFLFFFSMPSPDFRCLFLLHDFLIPFLTLFVVWFVSFPCFFFSFCLCSYSPSLSFCSLYVYPFPLKFAFAWLCRKTVEHGET